MFVVVVVAVAVVVFVVLTTPVFFYVHDWLLEYLHKELHARQILFCRLTIINSGDFGTRPTFCRI